MHEKVQQSVKELQERERLDADKGETKRRELEERESSSRTRATWQQSASENEENSEERHPRQEKKGERQV